MSQHRPEVVRGDWSTLVGLLADLVTHEEIDDLRAAWQVRFYSAERFPDALYRTPGGSAMAVTESPCRSITAGLETTPHGNSRIGKLAPIVCSVERRAGATRDLVAGDFFQGVPHIAAVDTSGVVLVEGISDRIAVETAAERLGRDLTSEGVSIVPMGGAHAIGRFLAMFGPEGANLRVAGLYDAGEKRVIGRAFRRAGFGSGLPLTRDDLEEIGFFVCIADLEDELIRALGAAGVEAVIAAQGHLDSFRTLQKQPAWRGRSVEAQLHRFMGSGATRKTRYARLLVEALDPAHIPRPLRLVLAHVRP